MRQAFSTEQVHPRDRFDLWMNFIRHNVIDNDAEPARRHAFSAELQSGMIGAVKLAVFRSSALTVRHTARHAARIASDAPFLLVPLVGRKFIEQAGRQAVLNPGDFALVDPTMPNEGRFSENSQLLMLSIERKQLESRLGNVRALTARPISSATTEARLACGYLTMMPSYAAGLGSAAERSVEAHLIDLVALSMQKGTVGKVPRSSFVRSAINTRLRLEIEARLSDSSLDPNSIASAAGVSVRYANAVLAEENTSLSQLVQTRRLQRCREILEDPAQNHRTVSEIARDWGFVDMTHFGRRFKSVYDMLPSECRRAARSG